MAQSFHLHCPFLNWVIIVIKIWIKSEFMAVQQELGDFSENYDLSKIEQDCFYIRAEP